MTKSLMMVVAGLVLMAGPMANANLMVNGGFESGTADWYVWAGSYPDAYFAVVNAAATAHEGSQYLTTVGPGNFEIAKNSDLSLPNTTYTMTIWVYPSLDCSDTYIQIGMQGWDNISGYSVGSASLVKGQWNPIQATFTTGSSGMTFQPHAYVWGLSSGSLAFDDITVVPEPATLGILVLGGLGLLRRKKAGR